MTIEQLSQAFRASSSSRTVTIDARPDPKTGQPIVRWKDVQLVFKDAAYIMTGDAIVSFMTDDNLEDLIPLRIRYHPGVVLEVVLDEACRHDDTPQSPQSPTIVQTEQLSSTAMRHPNQPSDQLAINTLESQERETGIAVQVTSQQISDISISICEPTEESLAVSSATMTEDAQMSLQAYHQLYRSYFQALTFGQLNQAAGIKEAMNEHFGTMQFEMDKNKVLQEKIFHMQQQMEEKQQQMLEMQQQALDRLSVIQSRIQTVITQTYELHEYPIPRLFIVLPKALKLRDRVGKPFSNQFRLFFLCECGAHTMTEGSRIPHEIHLAKHEGYDLDKPNEFFEKYGPYVLTMMQMIKYGFTIAGVVVPPLAHFKVVEGIEAVQKSLDLAKNNISSLVDETISFIQNQKSNANGGIDMAEDQVSLDRLEVLEGADLRQLESYLNVNDKGRVLGELYRIVTHEGHVKWVCMDHYRDNYRQSVMQQLREVIAANRGTFVEERGEIAVKLQSSTRAKQLYDAMIKARGIQELKIAAEWDVTLDDLRALESAISKANIINVTIDGLYFKGPALDAINRGRRFDPILKLMANGRIQSLRLENFGDFFSRVNISALIAAPHLRVLSMETGPQAKDKSELFVFARILKICPSLTELNLDARHHYPLFEATLSKISELRNLKRMRLADRLHSVDVSVHGGEIQSISMATVGLEYLSENDVSFIQKGFLTSLLIERTPQAATDNQLNYILRQSPNLSRVDIGCHPRRFVAVVNMIVSTREKILAKGGRSSLCSLELMADNASGVADLVTATLTFVDSSPEYKMSTNITLSSGETGPFSDLFERYGWTIQTLIAPKGINDHLSMQLDSATEDKGCNLTSLDLEFPLLTSRGIECMDRVIERCDKLRSLSFLFNSMDQERMERTEWMLVRHRKRLTSLTITGDMFTRWAPWLTKTFMTRNDLPNLETLKLFEVPQPYVPWVVTMMSAAPQTPMSELSSELQQQDTISVQSFTSAALMSESWRPLKRVYLQHSSLELNEWIAIFDAMDVSVLETLNFVGSNISQGELEYLIERLPGVHSSVVPLKSLVLHNTAFSSTPLDDAGLSLLSRLQLKVPMLMLEGIDAEIGSD
ncbi:hypothetical protein EDD21DRAFT_141720 [Dissophora ornata]|nr:hypothetical protein EDD21DRAFT_141720 [Dissophora ornata]